MTPEQQRRWYEAIAYVRAHSPFYRELFRDAPARPAPGDLPTTDKRMLSEHNAGLLCVPRERVVEVVSTSGTTGHPLVWMLTEPDMRRLALNEKLSFECAGFSAEDTVLVAVALDRCFIAGLAYTLGLRELGCAVVRTGPSSPLQVLEWIDRIRPTGIVAVPSFLRMIAGAARDQRFDLAGGGVKKAVCIGEPIRDGAFALNASGRAIEAAWGTRVFSTYGVTELANSLCECQAGQGGHLHDSQLYMEVLDDAGRPVTDGEVGELVATTFGVEGMPVVRYRTGDCAALHRGPCACGRTTPRIGPIVGRKNQCLKYKGATLFPSTLQAVLEDTEGVQAFVIIARAESGLSDDIEVLVHGSAPEALVRERLRARARIAPRLRTADPEEIESLQMPPNSRKRRYFVDLRQGA
jgi:phenylacetate-CoA ligase